MENASKALLIAGGILIAILIVTVAVFLFANYSSIGESYDQTVQTNEVQKFNENFTRYEGRENITIQEIVTLYNFVKDYELKTGVKVTINGISGLKLDEPANAIRNNQTQLFKVTKIEYDNTGVVNKITFSKSN